MKVKIYTDGAARGNPDGPGGYGTVLEFIDSKGQLHTKELSCGYKKTTNNRMELMAVIAGLEALNRPCEIELYSDSKYVVDAFNQHWIDGWLKKGWKRGKNEPVKNVDLWKRLLKAKEPHQITFIWVKGHDGHPQNERCDKMAVAAALGDMLFWAAVVLVAATAALTSLLLNAHAKRAEQGSNLAAIAAIAGCGIGTAASLCLAHHMEIASLAGAVVVKAAVAGTLSSIIVGICLYLLGYQRTYTESDLS